MLAPVRPVSPVANPAARRGAHAVRVALALLLALAAFAPTACADPNTLWKIVHGQCAPSEAAKGDPSPCLAVDLKGGAAVLKDRNGATQVLLIPTKRVTGIEDPAVLSPTAPNYFEDAWAARHFVNALAGQVIARDALSLAVNSIYGRSQNQLHIHVDCIRPDVRAALLANLQHIGPAWAPVDLGVSGRNYKAMRLAGEDLAGRNPFRLLAEARSGRAGRHGTGDAARLANHLRGRRPRLRPDRRPRLAGRRRLGRGTARPRLQGAAAPHLTEAPAPQSR